MKQFESKRRRRQHFIVYDIKRTKVISFIQIYFSQPNIALVCIKLLIYFAKYLVHDSSVNWEIFFSYFCETTIETLQMR